MLTTFLLSHLLILSPAWAESNALINDVTVGTDSVEVRTSRPVEVHAFKQKFPYRMLVIDFPKTLLGGPAYSLKGTGDIFKRVRVGQFQMKPEPIVRVVLKLEVDADYVAERRDDLNVVSLSAVAASAKAGPRAAAAPAKKAALGPAVAPASNANAVEDVVVSEDKVEIRLTRPVEGSVFSLPFPSRLVLDFPQTEFIYPTRFLEGKGGVLEQVKVGQFKDRPELTARVVLTMKQKAPHRIERAGNSVIVLLIPSAQAAKAAPVSVPVRAIPALVVVAAPAPAPVPAEAPALSAPLEDIPPPQPPRPPAAHPKGAALLGIEAGPDVVDLRLSQPVDFKASYEANPPRLVIELPKTSYQTEQKVIQGTGLFLVQVTAAQQGTGPEAPTRVVLELKKPVGYSIEKNPGSLHVILNP